MFVMSKSNCCLTLALSLARSLSVSFSLNVYVYIWICTSTHTRTHIYVTTYNYVDSLVICLLPRVFAIHRSLWTYNICAYVKGLYEHVWYANIYFKKCVYIYRQIYSFIYMHTHTHTQLCAVYILMYIYIMVTGLLPRMSASARLSRPPPFRVKWPRHRCATTRSNVWHNSHPLIECTSSKPQVENVGDGIACRLPHSCARQDSFISVTFSDIYWSTGSKREVKNDSQVASFDSHHRRCSCCPRRGICMYLCVYVYVYIYVCVGVCVCVYVSLPPVCMCMYHCRLCVCINT